MKNYDFSGYATRNDLKCSDGRTIRKDAFKDNDGQKVPLVWQHLHNEPINVLGHALLENREDGVYAYGVFNDTEAGKNAKLLVEHGDITALSIHANGLIQKGKDVLHGAIREVSLVLSGANPGALIDNLAIQHSDGSIDTDESEAIIYTGGELTMADNENKGKTVKEVFDSLTEEQKNVVYFMLGTALEEVEHSSDEDDDEEDDDDEDEDIEHSNLGGKKMKRNVFDNDGSYEAARPTLSHDQLKAIITDAQKFGSLKESFLSHAVEYGIENIDFLFPDARTIADSPDFVARRMEWVSTVISGAKHSPFSRIKSMSADITLEDARAKGYIKGNEKKEEFFALSKRITTPTTIYKKQKLDRDDIIDITDLDVVAWLKAEMRVMLDEEIARAALIGDGRDPASEDKINELNIRPIAKDDNFYAHKVTVPSNTAGGTLVELILRARKNYKGAGNPTFYTTEDTLTDLLLVKDKVGRRLYPTMAELTSTLRVASIIPVEVMENYVTETGDHLVGIMVNMKDYIMGADKGGQVSMFDDFDIDYNQYKYLIETRLSGALVKPKSALVFWRAVGLLVTPTAPTFVSGTNTLTIPTATGVSYFVDGVDTAASAIVIDDDVTVEAVADEGYYFAPNTVIDWDFTFNTEA